MAEDFPEKPEPEEITQQINRKPSEPAPVEVTQQTRIKSSEGVQQPVNAPPETVVVAARPSAAALQPPHRTFFGRIGHALFSRETRFGRFMRSVFGTILTIVVLFGVWAVAAYFLIYRPMSDNLTVLRLESTRTANQLQQANSNQQAAEVQAGAASTRSAQDQARLQVELARAELLRATNAITAARLALADDDFNAAATRLSDAQGFLNNSVYPSIEKQNPKQVETLKALFTVASNDLAENLSAVSGTTSGSGSGAGSTAATDSSLVDQDLLRIQAELDRVEKALK